MALEKVKIDVFDKNGGIKDTFNVLFNPEEYTINKDINYAVQGIPGLSGPLLQFVNGNLRTLEMELFFDTWDTRDLPKKDVRDQTNKIVNLMAIDPELHAPPHLNVSWSSLQFGSPFGCVLARVNQKFIMFDDSGTPVRARLTCTFNEDIDPEQEANQIKRQTADFSKAHVVIQDETLSGIAAHYYNNPQLWRPIAMANNIADPRSVFTGQMLSIPPLPYIDPESREVVI